MRWNKVKLGELCEMNSGGTPRRGTAGYYGGDIPWAKIGDIENAIGGSITHTEECITEQGLKSIRGRMFPKGTLLLAMYGSVGKTAFTGVDLSTNQAILGIRIKDSEVLNATFLKYWLDSMKQKLMDRAVGGTLQNISLGIVKQLEIPLPPLSIQQQIADTLDKADALRRKDQELLTKYEELAQSMFYEMFGDPVRNERGWEKVRLSELYTSKKEGTKCGPFGSALKKGDYTLAGIPVWVMDNIRNDEFVQNRCLYITEQKFNELIAYSTVPGDIIISRAGTVGKMCVVETRSPYSIISTNLIRLSLNERRINPYFFVKMMKYFGSSIGRLRTGAEGAFTHMNTGVLNSLEFALPPISLQEQYVSAFESIRQQKSFVQKSESVHLFNTLLSQSFN